MNPRILIFDIETAPNILKAFQLLNRNMIPYRGIMQERYIISSAWKWRGEKKAKSIVVDHKRPTDDKNICNKMRELIDEADAVVAHFGSGFDMPMLYGRMIFHKIIPKPDIAVWDTYRWAKHKFRFNSNRLDYLGWYLGIGRKINTDYSLWDGCMDGHLPSLRKMTAYNRQDVDLLSDVFERMLPYAPRAVHRLIRKIESQ